MKLICNIVRFTPLGEPQQIEEGDYVFEDENGNHFPATLYDVLKHLGLPEDYCRQQQERSWSEAKNEK